MKKLIFLLSLGMLGLTSAQTGPTIRCNYDEKWKEFTTQHPEAKVKHEQMLEHNKNPNNISPLVKKAVVTIPVVVHVLYKNPSQNITDAQIQSQLRILNEDFRKLNADFNSVVPAAFKPFAADMEIAFCLATKDPSGATTTGVVRKSVASNFNFDNNYFNSAQGGDNAWDTTKYLNIWVGAFTNQDLLGWAYPPAAAGYGNDGLCITLYAFGDTGTVFNTPFGPNWPYTKGRTGTHEIGHYFGLNHIWGSSNNATVCGSPDNNDGAADTPATNKPYFGVPIYPNNLNTCTTTPNGAMFMNYMDYCDDVTLAMFTADQKTIAQNALSNQRAGLLNSNACSLLSVDDVEKRGAINIFPSIATDFVSIASPVQKINEVEIFSADGRLVKRVNIKNETDKIDISSFSSGTYYVRVYDKSEFIKSLKFIKK